jgi:hypothetical protein
LKVAKVAPQGLAFVGAPGWVRDLAVVLGDEGVPVLLITADGDEIDAAAEQGLLVYGGKLDARDLPATLDAVGIREAIVGSNNDELNELAVERLSDELGRPHVYLLPRSDEEAAEKTPAGGDVSTSGRHPFGNGVTQHDLEEEVVGGAVVELRRAEEAQVRPTGAALLLLVLREGGRPVIVREGSAVDIAEGDGLVVVSGLADPERFGPRPGRGDEAASEQALE